MLHAIVTFAQEAVHEEESSKALFYIVGLVLTGWALLVAAIGIRRHKEWPPSDAVAKGIMGISALLVVATMASAIISS